MTSEPRSVGDDRIRSMLEIEDLVEGYRRPVTTERIRAHREDCERAARRIRTERRAAAIRRHLPAALLVVALVAWFAVSPAPAAERIEGRATVTDGDTIAAEGTEARIRLYGIDAPESGWVAGG